jgi:hypothetical protein
VTSLLLGAWLVTMAMLVFAQIRWRQALEGWRRANDDCDRYLDRIETYRKLLAVERQRRRW